MKSFLDEVKNPHTTSGPQVDRPGSRPHLVTAGLSLPSRCLSQEGLTFGNLKFQSEGSRLGLRKGRWEKEDLDIDREGVATYSVGAADSEPAEKQGGSSRMGGQLDGQGTSPFT